MERIKYLRIIFFYMKLARINISRKSIEYEEITPDSKFFLLGARGLSSKIILDEVPPNCDPLGEHNKLILANGLLTGSTFPCSARTSVGAKSPLTNGIKEANVGGRPSLMLAQHGIRALIFDGISSDLVYVLIKDGLLSIHSAEEYKGLGNYELHSKLLEKFGNDVGIYSIGPAGELLMKAASVAANDLEGYPSRHAGRGGLGAVMGSKGVKAVIVLPKKGSEVKMHDLKSFAAITKPFAKLLAESKEGFSTYGTALAMKVMSEYGGLPTKNYRMGSYEKVQDISGEKLHEVVITRGGKKRLACSPTCVIRCSNFYVDEKGNHVTSSLEYETMSLCGSNLMLENLDDVANIDHLCDDIGIDTIEFGVTVGVGMDSGRIKWGDSNEIFEILDEIRRGSDIGRLYGNGVCHLGREINYSRIPQVKGQGLSGYDPRVFKGIGLTYATSPMGADHTAGCAIAGRVASQTKDYGALTENNGKFDLSFELQLYTTILDSMGCCYFIGPSFENIELVSGALNAMHGLELTRDDLIKIGVDILKNELEFNEKAGLGKDTNEIPSFFRDEPSIPTNLTYTFSNDDLKTFWKRLDN